MVSMLTTELVGAGWVLSEIETLPDAAGARAARAAGLRLGAAVGEDAGDVLRLLRIGGVLDRAGEHDVVADDLDVDVGVGDQTLKHAHERRGVALDLEVEGDDLLAGAIEDDDVGLADLDAGDVDAGAACG